MTYSRWQVSIRYNTIYLEFRGADFFRTTLYTAHYIAIANTDMHACRKLEAKLYAGSEKTTSMYFMHVNAGTDNIWHEGGGTSPAFTNGWARGHRE